MTPRGMNASRLAALSVLPLAVSWAGSVHAADPHPFASPSAPDVQAVAPGTVFISDPSYAGRAVLQPITLTVKTTAIAQARQVKQVRLFRMDAGGLPRSYSNSLDDPGKFGDCEVYMTVVLPVEYLESGGRASLQLPPLDRSFLEVRRTDRTITAARWMMVFETTKSDTDPVFRLRQASKSTYFTGGWVFTLTPDKLAYADQEIKVAADAQIQPDYFRRQLNIADRTRTCHIAELLRVAGESDRVELHACAGDEGGLLHP